MSSAVAKLARPAGMKGQLIKNIQRNMGIAFVLASIGAGAWYVGVIQPRKQQYADFHKQLDAEKMFNRMKSKGVFWYTKAIEEAEED